MPGTFTPAQMYDNELNPVKGWPSPYAVTKELPLYIESNSGNARFGDIDNYQTDFKAGMVCHVALDGGDNQYKLRLGLAQDAVACFLFPNDKDFDVSGDKGNIIGSGNATLAQAAVSGTVAGTVVALVALGAYELETTEFVGSTFTPNLPLTAVGAPAKTRTSSQADNPGKIKAITWTQWRTGDVSDVQNLGCIGVVSDGGVRTNEFKKTMIRFWPTHLPSPTTQA